MTQVLFPRLPSILLSLIMTLLASSAMAGEHDAEWWSKLKIEKDLGCSSLPKDANLILELENRMDDDMTHAFYQSIATGLDLPIPEFKGWSFAAYIKRIDRDKGPDENRLYFDLSRKMKAICGTDWDAAMRARLDIRDLQDEDSLQYRFRPKLELIHPLIGSTSLYCNAESDYHFELDLWTRYRLGVGLQVPFAKQTSLRVGCQMEANRIPDKNAGIMTACS